MIKRSEEEREGKQCDVLTDQLTSEPRLLWFHVTHIQARLQRSLHKTNYIKDDWASSCCSFLVVTMQWKRSQPTRLLECRYLSYRSREIWQQICFQCILFMPETGFHPLKHWFSLFCQSLVCTIKFQNSNRMDKTAISPSFLQLVNNTFAHAGNDLKRNSKSPPCCRALEQHTRFLPAHFKTINKTSVAWLFLFLLSQNEWHFPLSVVAAWLEGTNVCFQCFGFKPDSQPWPHVILFISRHPHPSPLYTV